MLKADLHMHSYYSDGDYSPSVVAQKAAQAGCDAVALTDHDTVAGVAEMDEAARQYRIRNVHGIEISTFDGAEAHILGYGIDIEDPVFLSYVQRLEEGRRWRSGRLLEKLAAHGLTVPVEFFAGKIRGELSRSHIARALVELGFEPDAETAFRNWLRVGAPAFEPVPGRDPREAIDRIRAAGGVAVLAHPMRLGLDDYRRKDLIRKLAGWGLSGIEAVYKRSSPETVRHFRRIADSCGLFVTSGADFHGDRNEILPRQLSPRACAALGL